MGLFMLLCDFLKKHVYIFFFNFMNAYIIYVFILNLLFFLLHISIMQGTLNMYMYMNLQYYEKFVYFLICLIKCS